jgi:hypothetical protein
MGGCEILGQGTNAIEPMQQRVARRKVLSAELLVGALFLAAYAASTPAGQGAEWAIGGFLESQS